MSTDVRVTESSTPPILMVMYGPCAICGETVTHNEDGRVDWVSKYGTHAACDTIESLYE